MPADRLGVERRWVDVHAIARPDHEREHDPEDQRDSRHHLEIDERLDPDAPDLLEVARPCNSMNDNAEDNWRNDHRDQLEETVAQNFQLNGEAGRRHPEHYTQHESNQHLDEEGFIQRHRLGRQRCGIRRHRQGNRH